MQAWTLVLLVAFLLVVIIVVSIVLPGNDSVVALGLLFVFAFARWSLVLISGGQPRADALLLTVGIRGLGSSTRRPLGEAQCFVLLDELVDYFDEALLIQLVVARVQNNVDAALVDGTN